MQVIPRIDEVIAEARTPAQLAIENVQKLAAMAKYLSAFTNEQLCLAHLPSGWRLTGDGKVLDNDEKERGDYYGKPEDWAAIKAALVGFVAMLAIFKNDTTELQKSGIVGVDHAYSARVLLHWTKRALL